MSPQPALAVPIPPSHAMRPSLWNYALAHTCGISVATGVVCALAFLFTSVVPLRTLATDWTIAFWAVIAAIISAAIGSIFGILVIWQLFGRLAGRLQGAPFRVGDHVWILAGKHKGKLTRVYAVWNERGQVRVELGADAQEKVTAVFCIVAICRALAEDSLANKLYPRDLAGGYDKGDAEG